MIVLNIDYDRDFYGWALMNADLLRQRRFGESDVEHIAEELESMGGSEKRELISRLTRLLAHLLKWQFQPDKRSPGWRLTIVNQRHEIEALLVDSPSLMPAADAGLTEAYRRAKMEAAAETGIDENRFPQDCPYACEQAMDHDFWPA